MTPIGRHRGAPGRAKCAMPAARNAKPALAWRYPMRTPARVRKPSPPAPGKAAAASAHSETDSRIAPTTCRKDDPARIGSAPSGAGGAILDAADARPSAITSSGAPARLPPSPVGPRDRQWRPEIPAGGRPSRNCDATDSPAATDNPRPWMPSTPPTTGCTPAMPNKKEYRSEGSCASGTTAPTTEVSMS